MSGFRLVVGWRKLVWGGRAHPRVFLAVTLRCASGNYLVLFSYSYPVPAVNIQCCWRNYD
jgi:hypothetical protein